MLTPNSLVTLTTWKVCGSCVMTEWDGVSVQVYVDHGCLTMSAGDVVSSGHFQETDEGVLESI